ncbi:hypothetical protein BCR42DRAFT_400275 [Absidia repens]|uniref:Uncharacterized protein n=1 Tax=Absidia repens TaxID=90262 RepID=A0A1X2J115_9FUNG|nr:hypothetical protein BCR42DRAFT_400275 [Absidia repens]
MPSIVYNVLYGTAFLGDIKRFLLLWYTYLSNLLLRSMNLRYASLCTIRSFR